MNPDQPRRVATVPLSVPQGQETPPPAPPLPPQQRARNALNRFLGIPARASDGDEDGSQGTGYWAEANRATLGRLPSLSVLNASAIYKTGLEINSLSINDEGTHALLAGREIFKTIRVDEASCTEDKNLRSSIKTFDAHVAAGGPTKDAVNVHDVAWGKGNYGNFIAAATYNGPIIVYDLFHPGVEVARLHEHRRQVHRVTFNPHAGQHFLSGSQDGTVRLWDLRDLRRDSSTFSSRFTTTGQHEGVRDVKWSPTDVFALALCTDGGFVQRWDTRKLKTPLTKIAAHTRIAAHTSPCATIDWHPDGKHVLSASADKTVKVWNLGAEGGRRTKPAYEIKTPHPLRNARWRPSCQSSIPKDRGARLCSQIVTSYEQNYDVLHIWDFRRPSLPFREIQGYRSAPTDLLWHSQDLLWTVGKEGMFLQHDVKFADKVLNKRNMQNVAVSPLGEFNVVTQKRPGKSRPGVEIEDSDTFLPQHHRKFDEKKESPATTGRGGAEDSVDEAFLSSSFGKKSKRYESGQKNTKQSTEQSNSTSVDNQQPPSLRTLSLEDIMTKSRVFKPGQGTAAGALPGVSNPLLLIYFAQKYKTRPLSEPPSVESYLSVQELFEANARAAQQASMYRMAQSWRIVGQAVMTELRRRARAHREVRVRGKYPKKASLYESPFAKRARKYLTSERRLSSKPATPLVKPVKAAESLNAILAESTSNVPTPVAKPVAEQSASSNNKQTPLKEISQDDDGLTLPPSLITPTRLKQQDAEKGRQVSSQSWYHSADALEERKAELSSWRAPSRDPISLDMPPHTNDLERHDSNDSFGMFPSVSSRDASMPMSSAASMTSLMNTVHENLVGESPYGSMNIGSSSSSEPNLGQSVYPQSFFSFPSVANPGQPPPETAVSSSSDSNLGPPVAINIRPASERQPTDIPPARDIASDVKALALNNQLSFSSGSEALSSPEAHKSNLSSHPDPIPEKTSVAEDMEASGTIVPPRFRSHSRLLHSRDGSNSMTKLPALVHHQADSAPPALLQRSSLHPDSEPFIPADFVGTDFDIDTEQQTPFTLISLLNQILTYHTSNVPDPQAATHFLLLLTPLLPQTHPLAQAEIDKTISAYSEHFAILGYTDEEIYSLLQNTFESLIKSGLQPLYAESIISTYHDQLQRSGLFNNAAYLRRLTYPTYPGVFEQGLKDNQMSFLCGTCKKPINNPVNKFRCENCETRQETCPICWCATSPFEAPEKRIGGSKIKQEKSESVEEPLSAQPQENIIHDTADDIWARNKVVEADAHVAAVAAAAAAATITESANETHTPDLHKPLLFSTCLLCNHTTHTACLRAWHGPSAEISEGLCPTTGCLCACTAGLARTSILDQLKRPEADRRASKNSLLQRHNSNNNGNNPGGPPLSAGNNAGGTTSSSSGRIREDDWVAAESKAAREAAGNLMVRVSSPTIAAAANNATANANVNTGGANISLPPAAAAAAAATAAPLPNQQPPQQSQMQMNLGRRSNTISGSSGNNSNSNNNNSIYNASGGLVGGGGYGGGGDVGTATTMARPVSHGAVEDLNARNHNNDNNNNNNNNNNNIGGDLGVKKYNNGNGNAKRWKSGGGGGGGGGGDGGRRRH